MPRPKTGGRQKGTPNKATADVKALAGKWGPAVIDRLATLAGLKPNEAGKAESEQAQVAALRELADRAYGKPKQEMAVDAEVRHSFVARLPSVKPKGEWGKS